MALPGCADQGAGPACWLLGQPRGLAGACPSSAGVEDKHGHVSHGDELRRRARLRQRHWASM